MKYLLFGEKVATIIDIPKGATSEDYAELMTRFEREHCKGRFDFPALRKLHEDQKRFEIYYDWELAGSAGASYEMFVLPGTSESDVESCEDYIRRSFDVVRLRVLRFARLVDFPVEFVEPYTRTLA